MTKWILGNEDDHRVLCPFRKAIVAVCVFRKTRVNRQKLNGVDKNVGFRRVGLIVRGKD